MLLLALALQTMDLCCKRLLLSALTILQNFRAFECNFPSQLSASDHFFPNFSLLTAKMAQLMGNKILESLFFRNFFTAPCFGSKNIKFGIPLCQAYTFCHPMKIHPQYLSITKMTARICTCLELLKKKAKKKRNFRISLN